jgi:uncharacterized protein (DUF342 family)
MILKFEILNNNLKVYLSLLNDESVERQQPVTAQMIYDLLKEKEITYGILQEAVQKLDGKTEEVTDVLIAEGTPPTVGNNAEIQILKRPKRKEDVLPSVSESGDIDYISPREGWIVVVNKGDEIAVKLSPTQGESGIDVFKREIPGIWGKDFDLGEVGGFNTVIEGPSITAAIDGFVIPRATKLNVEPVFRIYDDVGPTTGSIDIPPKFQVELAISKDIKKGFFVKAHKITVGGCIEDSEVTAEELTINQGIVGTSNIPITAKKIDVGYINGSRPIYADSLRVLREISNGAQIAAAQVKAHTIQGSTVIASECIWTDYVNGQNKIMVGIDYKAKSTVDRCAKELKEMEEPFEQLKKVWHNQEKRLMYLSELTKKNPQHPLVLKELPQIKELKEKYEYYTKKMKLLQEERDGAMKRIYPDEKPFLLVRVGFSRDNSSGAIVDPQSVITLHKEVLKILEPTSGGLITLDDNKRLIFAKHYNIKELKSRMTRIEL